MSDIVSETPPKFTSKILEQAYRKLNPEEDLGAFASPIPEKQGSVAIDATNFGSQKTAVGNNETTLQEAARKALQQASQVKGTSRVK